MLAVFYCAYHHQLTDVSDADAVTSHDRSGNLSHRTVWLAYVRHLIPLMQAHCVHNTSQTGLKFC